MDNAEILMDGTPREVFRQADRVKAAGLDVPKPAELARALQKKGVPMPDDILTASEFTEYFLKRFGESNNATT